jgi:hypothetical protein
MNWSVESWVRREMDRRLREGEAIEGFHSVTLSEVEVEDNLNHAIPGKAPIR